ncbi:MAG: neutral/alkaline ceramidase [Aquabacterium sp.]|uniref:neutral/alkaline ceramidase n=1 Tax=Aquabacterium sp. TaxID=1872578 RepID=UPI0025BB0740|nr:neutral/alkaline ceramidase [Aquabacterium sp.]MBI5925486.1 neutral/alkaline ceramidase [Aquabacterium sp.]
MHTPRRLSMLAATAATAWALMPHQIAHAATAQPYQLGVGMSDITGEAAEVGMMGYAELSQKTAGIHQRLRARAFIVQDAATQKSAVIVITDTGLVTQSIHQAVLKRLAAKYGALYNAQNVLISATHTHAGPGGYSHYALYNITILGFQQKTFNAIVDGIVEAIDQAHQRKAPGDILLNQGELTNASRNRSTPAFRLNAAADRAAFPQEIDPLMSVLTFRQGGKAVGALSLFPTHGTSMTNQNKLISGDNKGYAAYHWEHEHAGVRYRTDKAPFVAAFAQTNPGDMSPNLNLKPGSGPTEDEFENTRIIGLRQADKALSLSAQSTTLLQGAVDYRMRYVDMSQVTVSGAYTPDGKPHTTCPAALGTSFAAGSEEDGPGPGIAKEGQSNPFLAAVGGFVFWPSESLRQCHGVKEVVIPVGDMKPYPWSPEVLPLQLVRLGQLYLATLPGEPTIMSGYRIRRQLAQTLGVDVKQVLVVGYTNAYTQYITTPEEYSIQDYEGGSTLFGPYTQPAYQQELDKLARDMVNSTPTINNLQPRDLNCCQMNFQTGVLMDLPAFGKRFGSVLKDASGSYKAGDTVSVRFQTGHPKNNLRRNGSFLEVQRQVGGNWVAVADDGDWSTRYRWTRTFGAESAADISWTIPAGTPAGSYRIVHYGDAKNLIGTITSFTGTSSVFQVQAN